ncbi:MAG: Gfo/Idh/MocA family oxidoreductase [Candidatus Hydrogenedentes bacterium]|nr:Gfo/Idh/MocA family oxidoreductase [Candidatus Hydrogenedentota bacterium]
MSETRRAFLGKTAAAVAASGVAAGEVFADRMPKPVHRGKIDKNSKIRIAVIGFNGRGKDHIKGWLDHEDAELVALCDVDQTVLERGAATVKEKTKKAPRTYTDMRDLISDKGVDAVSIATPNHWHSLAAIWAIQSGKDVYVEKPCSHNVFEGRQLVNAARKHNAIVQHGTQVRSSAGIIDAIQKLREGVIGDVYMARGLCFKRRDTIGHKPNSAPPPTLDWNLWQGPAPEREYNPNIAHYNWHWFWNYGNGDIGNQGVHQMDVARWGLNVGLPNKVSSMGGMFLFDDDKEVPNTITTAFHFGDNGKNEKMLVFDTRPWYTNDEDGAKIGILFYGSKGFMVIDSYNRYKTYLGDKKEPGPTMDKGGDHYGNFLDAVRARDPKILHAEILEGHLSSSLCHLGLISVRLGRSFDYDAEREQIPNDPEANALLTAMYRVPFVVPKIDA